MSNNSFDLLIFHARALESNQGSSYLDPTQLAAIDLLVHLLYADGERSLGVSSAQRLRTAGEAEAKMALGARGVV
jgi:hypothetical protein